MELNKLDKHDSSFGSGDDGGMKVKKMRIKINIGLNNLGKFITEKIIKFGDEELIGNWKP